MHAYIECGYLSEAHNPPEYGSSDNRLTVYGTDGYVYAETDGFWGACTKATNGRLITGKDPRLAQSSAGAHSDALLHRICRLAGR